MKSSKSGSGEGGNMISEAGIKRVLAVRSSYSRDYIIEKD
jgi:hypothetical protein